MRRVITALLLTTSGTVYADPPTTDLNTNLSFLAETAVLQMEVPVYEASRWEGRYQSYFEKYDIPENTNLYRAYAEVVHQYARILTIEKRYEQAIRVIDRYDPIQTRGYIQHMLQTRKAQILTEWAETETGQKRTELLNQAEQILKSLQW